MSDSQQPPTAQPTPPSPTPTPTLTDTLNQVVQELQQLRASQAQLVSLQAQILEELQAQRPQNPDNTPNPPPSSLHSPFDPPPDPIPPLLQHLDRPSVRQPLHWLVVVPLRRFLWLPVQRLVLKPLRWGVWKPIHYLALGPISYGLRQLALTQRILRITETIEEQPWENQLDRLVAALGEMGLFKLIAALLLTLGYGVFVVEIFERRIDRQYQAWSVINTAASVNPSYEDRGQPEAAVTDPSIASAAPIEEGDRGNPKIKRGSTGEGGRTKALQELYADNQSLAGLQAPGAYLPQLNLGGWCLPFLKDCLKSVDLSGANLEGAFLFQANLNHANLWEAKLDNAFLRGANLSYSALGFVNLAGASLVGANLKGAILRNANLEEVHLWSSNLEKTDLENVRFQGAILVRTRFQDSRNLEAEQLAEAYLCRTQLPLTIKVDPNRDCEIIPPILVKRYGFSESYWRTLLSNVPSTSQP